MSGVVMFGDSVLRQKAKPVAGVDITSPSTRRILHDLRTNLVTKELGVGIAAPQIGISSAIALIVIQPKDIRPDVEVFERVLINPVIREYMGTTVPMWESCLSAAHAALFAQVPRHEAVKIEYFDENGVHTTEIMTGLPAHVAQHEVDHLNGVLFVDRVEDTTTYISKTEYTKQIVKKRKAQHEK